MAETTITRSMVMSPEPNDQMQVSTWYAPQYYVGNS